MRSCAVAVVITSAALLLAFSQGAGAKPSRVELHHAVTTKNAAAQAAFDRGLLDYYAYNVEAAEHEFYAAADLDPHLAMAYWGIAMANASDLNIPPTDDREQKAAYDISQAQDLEPYASPAEREYIEAAAQRFSTDPKADHDRLLLNYRDAMKRISDAHPEDADAAALYGEANLYIVAGKYANDKAALNDAGRLAYARRMAGLLPYFQSELKRFPTHVGLLHFYIHAANEASAESVAIPAAELLGSFALPNEAAHLTHMPGHIFLKTGLYDRAVTVAQRSVEMDNAVIACCHPGYYAEPRYYHSHNVEFLLVALTESQRFADALRVAQKDGTTAFIARQMIATQQWSDILRLTSLKPGPTLAFARGLAYAQRGEGASARAALRAMPKVSNDDPSWKLTVTAMQLILQAHIAMLAQQNSAALRFLEQAAAAADRGDAISVAEFPALYYDSPHLELAKLAVRLHQSALAKTAYLGELKSVPHSPAALHGLAVLRHNSASRR